MNYKYNVSVIVVNFNGKKYIKPLFDSLIQQRCTDFTFEIIFVDNASTDDSLDFLSTNYSFANNNISIIKNKKNLGFAGGNNIGVLASRGEYVVFLNNDTRVNEDWLNTLYHFILSNQDYGMVNSKILFYYDFIPLDFYTTDRIILDKTMHINDKTYVIDNKFCKNILYQDDLVCFGNSRIYIPLLDGSTGYRIRINCKDVFGVNASLKLCDIKKEIETKMIIDYTIGHKNIEEDAVTLVQNAGSGITKRFEGYDIGFCEENDDRYSESYELQSGCGAGIILSKRDFIACGMFDKQFFMYYEDTDLSFRIRKAGKKIMFCPDAIVRHIHTGSSKEWSPFFRYYVNRNRLLFIYKNISKITYLKLALKQLLRNIRRKEIVELKAVIASLLIVFVRTCQFRGK